MKRIPQGTYIVAVSGGVDSMALLNMLRQQPQLHLVVAHVDHGIRSDGKADARLVSSFCKSHNIIFISKELHLGIYASEAQARTARYKFLQQCRTKYKAHAIITAHHQDDAIETALINLLRGTGWRGLAPLVGSAHMLRPLLDVSKKTLLTYAKTNAIPWREDSTNADQKYLRNYIRLTVRPLLDELKPGWEQTIMRLIRKQQVLRRKIDDELERQLTLVSTDNKTGAASPRYFWIMLPPNTAQELLQALCRRIVGTSLVGSMAQSALLFVKTAKAGKLLPLNNMWQFRVTSDTMIVEHRQSMIS